jgi:hypothetical protein
MIRIALDAMGGDKGVEATVGGAAKLSLEEVDIRVLLVGDVQSMSEMLDGVRYDPTRIVDGREARTDSGGAAQLLVVDGRTACPGRRRGRVGHERQHWSGDFGGGSDV